MLACGFNARGIFLYSRAHKKKPYLVLIRVQFQRSLPPGALDVLRSGILSNSKELVVQCIVFARWSQGWNGRHLKLLSHEIYALENVSVLSVL